MPKLEILFLIFLNSLVQCRMLDDYSLQVPFLDSGINNREWNFGGDAFMNVDKYIRLTANQKSQFGWLWSRKPLTTNITKDWRIDVDFRVGEHDGLSGDGFAIWLTEEKEKEGTAFGSVDVWKGLGCFFDSYENTKHPETWPYISCMVNDGTKRFDHSKDGFDTKIGGCSAFFRVADHPTSFSIKYEQGKLSLTHNVELQDRPTLCFSVDNIKLPESMYIGFSAATGGVSDVHDILKITTYTLDGVKSQVGGAPPLKSNFYEDDTSVPVHHNSGLFTFLKNLLIGVIILFIVYVIWVYYQSTKTQSYKRF